MKPRHFFSFYILILSLPLCARAANSSSLPADANNRSRLSESHLSEVSGAAEPLSTEPQIDERLPGLADGIQFHRAVRPGFSSWKSDTASKVAQLHNEIRKSLLPLRESLGVCACDLEDIRRSLRQPVGQTSLRDVNGKRFAVSVLTYDLALRTFQRLEKAVPDPNIALKDGCFARAHETAILLEKRGLLTGKVMVRGKFQIVSNRLKKRAAFWRFHVAPIVVIRTGAKLGIWVLDPALFSEPAPIENWLALLMQNPKAELKEIFLTNRFVMHPNHVPREINGWSSSDIKTMHRYLRQGT